MRKFGLIGFPLKHSFSKKYFTEKFEREGLDQHQYDLFEIDTISKLDQVLNENPELIGVNVTIPYKEQVIPYLDELEPSCSAIGAVNTIKISNGKLTGYNTDYIGFKVSLSRWLSGEKCKGLVLGSGGASRAVKQALHDLEIPFLQVSRLSGKGPDSITYHDLANDKTFLSQRALIINTTPLGTFPDTQDMPAIPLFQITAQHKVYDLIYNPTQTLLMKSI